MKTLKLIVCVLVLCVTCTCIFAASAETGQETENDWMEEYMRAAKAIGYDDISDIPVDSRLIPGGKGWTVEPITIEQANMISAAIDSEYARLEAAGRLFYNLEVKPEYTEETIYEINRDNKLQNYYSIGRDLVVYSTLANNYGEEYQRYTIIDDIETDMIYMNKMVDRLEEGMDDWDFLTYYDVVMLRDYIRRRMDNITDENFLSRLEYVSTYYDLKYPEQDVYVNCDYYVVPEEWLEDYQ
jgi:hypothetical protein